MCSRVEALWAGLPPFYGFGGIFGVLPLAPSDFLEAFLVWFTLCLY
jgi:hypothetical protein